VIVVVDTSALLALLDADDAHRQRLRALRESAPAAWHGGRGVASSNFVAWRTGPATG
jgi:predicted nucleic acid-binding protein